MDIMSSPRAESVDDLLLLFQYFLWVHCTFPVVGQYPNASIASTPVSHNFRFDFSNRPQYTLDHLALTITPQFSGQPLSGGLQKSPVCPSRELQYPEWCSYSRFLIYEEAVPVKSLLLQQ